MVLTPKRRFEIPEEIEEKIQNCKHQFQWTSNPQDDCSACKYRKYCKALFFGLPDALDYNRGEMAQDLKNFKRKF